MQQVEEVESSSAIENLITRLGNETLCPRLQTLKVVLLSIVCALTPNRSCAAMTRALAERAVNVTIKINKLVNTAEETSNLLGNLTQLKQTLGDVHAFVKSETQSNIFYRLLLGNDLFIQYIILDRQLTALLVAFEKTVTVQGSIEYVPANTKGRLGNHDGTSIFHGAKDIVANGGEYYSVGGNFFMTRYNKSIKGIIENFPVLTTADILPEEQLYQGRGCRIYSAQTSGKVIVVKLFEGHHAENRCLEAAKFYQNVMHPNVSHMIAVCPQGSALPFLVFNGDYEGTVNGIISLALKNTIKQSLILGLQTVIGLSSGLDYLFSQNVSVTLTGLDHFVILSRKGKIVISFDPAGLESMNRQDQLSREKFIVFEKLCQKTFNTAREIPNHCQMQIQRNRIGESDRENLSRSQIEKLDDVAGESPEFNHPPTLSQAYRRELVWNSLVSKTVSLQDISNEYKDYLNSFVFESSSSLALIRHRGRNTTQIAHQCRWYKRLEISLTADITRCAIVSHSTPPLVHELCCVCKNVLQDVEFLGCSCVPDSDKYAPAIQCSNCSGSQFPQTGWIRILNNACQYLKLACYRIAKRIERPGNTSIWYTTVYLNDELYGGGFDSIKSHADEKAAFAAVIRLGQVVGPLALGFC